jgi:hypothetical protein
MWNGTTVPGSSAGSVSYPAIIALYTEDGPRFLCSWQGEEPRVSSDSHHWRKQVATPALSSFCRAFPVPSQKDSVLTTGHVFLTVFHVTSIRAQPVVAQGIRKCSCRRHHPTPVALCIAQPPAGSHNAREEKLSVILGGGF